jgi:ADP-ribose pyrophosphatase YjhB (NUDIX family)
MHSERPIVGVGAIVVDDGALLMVQRGEEPAAGLWSIPGGRVEWGESLARAVAREVAEETGLEVVAGTLAGIHEVLGPPHYVVLDFHATLRRRAAPAAGADAADARWVPLGAVDELECTPRLVEVLTSWGVLAGASSAEE